MQDGAGLLRVAGVEVLGRAQVVRAEVGLRPEARDEPAQRPPRRSPGLRPRASGDRGRAARSVVRSGGWLRSAAGAVRVGRTSAGSVSRGRVGAAQVDDGGEDQSDEADPRQDQAAPGRRARRRPRLSSARGQRRAGLSDHDAAARALGGAVGLGAAARAIHVRAVARSRGPAYTSRSGFGPRGEEGGVAGRENARRRERIGSGRTRARVAVVRTKPETVLDDVASMMRSARLRASAVRAIGARSSRTTSPGICRTSPRTARPGRSRVSCARCVRTATRTCWGCTTRPS